MNEIDFLKYNAKYNEEPAKYRVDSKGLPRL